MMGSRWLQPRWERIVQVPAYLVVHHLATGELRQVLTGLDEPRGDIWLLWPPGRMDLPRVRVFADFVRDLLSEL